MLGCDFDSENRFNFFLYILTLDPINNIFHLFIGRRVMICCILENFYIFKNQILINIGLYVLNLYNIEFKKHEEKNLRLY